jgi:hypothetical protein
VLTNALHDGRSALTQFISRALRPSHRWVKRVVPAKSFADIETLLHVGHELSNRHLLLGLVVNVRPRHVELNAAS